ncbi:MAG: phosphate ABC transporter substrate-binding protein [Candidatus Thiodiazotropha sp.]|jgi:ABC-type phosphate transport system substrate-binding protein
MNISHKATLILLLSFIFTCAKADVVVVVSATSTVNSLTKNQVSNIFLGKTSSFPNGDKAIAIDQKDGSSEWIDFYKKVSGKSDSQLKSYWATLIFSGRKQPPKQLADSSEVKKSISSNPSQISYIAEETVDSSVKVVLKP